LVGIPRLFDLPIAYGTAGQVTDESLNASQKEKIRYGIAFIDCSRRVESYIAKEHPSENTIIIAEDRHKIRNSVKKIQADLQGKMGVLPYLNSWHGYPYAHIRDTVHFAAKKDSAMLQVADICAFVVRGALSDHPKIDPMFDKISPQLLAPDIAAASADLLANVRLAFPA
jgi:Protein of unknown function (DUF3800)